jgi:hypothetical protein
VRRSATLLVIDVGYHRNTPSECRRIALGKTLSSRRPKTTENLSKLVLNREGNVYEGYGEEHNGSYFRTEETTS